MRKTKGGFLITQIKQVQGRILYVLWQEDGLSVIELARRTGLAKTTLTSMLERMDEKGFLERVPDIKDRRVLRIFLAARAQILSDKYNQVSDEMSRIFYKDFSEEEIVVFEKSLEKILGNLVEREKEV